MIFDKEERKERKTNGNVRTCNIWAMLITNAIGRISPWSKMVERITSLWLGNPKVKLRSGQINAFKPIATCCF
jgi:hypothetical protein